MTRINTNVPSLLSALYMNRNMKALNVALERMATGLRINSARDDPDGVIVTDVLRGELTGLQSAISNAERANNLMATAEGSMSSIADLIMDIRQIVFEVSNSGNMTDQEFQAKQLQLDKDVEAINTIVKSAAFAGQQLLDGSLGYRTSGVDTGVIRDLAIHKAPVGATGGGVPVQVDLVTPAEQGALLFAHAAVASAIGVRFTGPHGSEMLQFAAGTTSSELVTAVNSISEQTGLRAELINGDPAQGVRILTEDYGSRAQVSVELTSGNPADFALTDAMGNPTMADHGVDIIVNINTSRVVGQGLKCHYASATLDAEFLADEAWNAAGPPASTSFEITSGGALFQLGPRIGPDQQDSIGIPALDSTNLGTASLGYLSDLASGGSLSLISGHLREMIRVVDAADSQVTAIRSRIGSFQNNTLNMAINNLKQSQENISAARSTILDADYAQETAAMVRQQILVQASQAAMSLAQQVPQHVLSLLLG